MPFNPEFWTQMWGDFVASAMTWLPRLVEAVLWLLLGWVVAGMEQLFFLTGLLRKLGLGRDSKRINQHQDTSRCRVGAVSAGATWTIARNILYWIVLLVFVLGAAESLGLQRVVNTLEGLIAYLPSVLAAALIVLIGGLIAGVCCW